VIAQGHLILHDPYSYSAPGHLWLDHEWLTEVLMGWLYNHLGIIGLKLMKLGCTALVVVFLVVAMGETGASTLTQFALLLVACLAVEPQVQFGPQIFPAFSIRAPFGRGSAQGISARFRADTERHPGVQTDARDGGLESPLPRQELRPVRARKFARHENSRRSGDRPSSQDALPLDGLGSLRSSPPSGSVGTFRYGFDCASQKACAAPVNYAPTLVLKGRRRTTTCVACAREQESACQ
jgi:hypothetical protein